MKAPPGGKIWSRTFGQILAPFYHQERYCAFSPISGSIACKDRTIKLLDYRARWYDPSLGRFVSADTIVPDPANPQSLNRYMYVLGNPLRYTDPSGHLTDDQIIDYTDYNTDSELEKLKGENPEVYWMLRALHLGDTVCADWMYPSGIQSFVTYKATLSEGRLIFDYTGTEIWENIEASGFIENRFGVVAKGLGINRDTPDGGRNVYSWSQGDDPETCYKNRWGSNDTHHEVTYWEHLRDFKAENAIGVGLIGAGVGLMTPAGPAGAALGFAIGVTVDLTVGTVEHFVGVPAGEDVGDQVYKYNYDSGWTEVTIIRDRTVILHEWRQ